MEKRIFELTFDIKRYLGECDSTRKFWNKADKSPVTIADIGVQVIFNNWVKENFSNDSIIAEESGNDIGESLLSEVGEKLKNLFPEKKYSISELKNSIDYSGKSDSDFMWYLDPIDGTKGYLRNEQFAVAISRVNKQNQVELAILICPNLPYPYLESSGDTGTIFYSEAGNQIVQYSYQDFSRSQIIQTRTFSGIKIAKSVEKAHGNSDSISYLSSKKENVSIIEMDSQAKYGLLIRGEANLYIRYPSIPDYMEKWWDHVAGAAMVIKMGGIFTDTTGKKLEFNIKQKTLPECNGVVASMGIDHLEIISILDEYRKI